MELALTIPATTTTATHLLAVAAAVPLDAAAAALRRGAGLVAVGAGEIAERWAVLNGLPGEEALQCVTWQLKCQWSFAALRANECAGPYRVRPPRDV